MSIKLPNPITDLLFRKTTDTGRPEPLTDAAVNASGTHGAVMGIITTLVAAGLVSATTGQLLTALYGLIPGVLAVGSAVLAARGTALAARVHVTPVADPRAADGRPLVPQLPSVPSMPPATAVPATNEGS